MKSCLDCKLYTGCKDPAKGFGYSCDEFKRIKSSDLAKLVESETKLKTKAKSIVIPGAAPKLSKTKVKPIELAIEEEEGGSVDELKLGKLLKDALSSKNRAPTDFKINDNELKEYPNFWSFCIDKQGLNTKPFARQLWLAVVLFSEWCPDCSDDQWHDIHSVPVDEDPHITVENRVQLLNYGVCPVCDGRKSTFIKKKKLNIYIELDGCIGQRGGKSTTIALISAYYTHKLLKMQKPTVLYGLLPDSVLTMTFIGLTFGRAQQTLWSPYHNMLKTSPWFQEYHKLLDFYGDKYDEDYYKFGDIAIQYRHRNLFISPSGPSKRTLRGDTRVFSAIDEIGWFPNEEGDDERERQSANEVYIAVDRSLKTIRAAADDLFRKHKYDNAVTAILCNISSPSHVRDKIMTLVKANEFSREALAIHLPTWEFNPNMARRKFKKEFRDDPVKAERDFGANPPKNEMPLFGNEDKIKKLFGPIHNKVKYQYVIQMNKRSGRKMKHATLIASHAPGNVQPSIMSLDAGYSNNSFSIAIGHNEHLPGNRVRYVCDVLIEVAPNYKKNVLNYTRIYDGIIKKLLKKFNVKAVVSDRWQNKKILHDIAEEFPDILVHEYSLRYQDIIDVRDYMQDDNQTVYLPRTEIKKKDIENLDITTGYPHCFKYMPAAHLLFQMQTVRDTGNVVEKGSNLTDDIFRAVALLISHLIDVDFMKEHVQGELAARGPVSVGAVAGKSAAGMPASMQQQHMARLRQSQTLVSGGGAVVVPSGSPSGPSSVGVLSGKSGLIR